MGEAGIESEGESALAWVEEGTEPRLKILWNIISYSERVFRQIEQILGESEVKGFKLKIELVGLNGRPWDIIRWLDLELGFSRMFIFELRKLRCFEVWREVTVLKSSWLERSFFKRLNCGFIVLFLPLIL